MLTIIGIPIGPDTYTTCYYDALRNAGVQVVKGDLSGRWLLKNFRGVSYLHIHWPSFFYADRSSIASLRKFVRFVFLLALTRVFRIRLVWTAHNLYPHDRSKIAVLDRLARKVTVWLSYRIFVHGSCAASVVTREFPGAHGKLVTIPHGNWIDYYAHGCSRGGARQRLGLAPSEFVFLFLGLCKEYKNLEYLIRCFQNGPFGETALWIVGRFQSAEYRDRVKAQIEIAPSRIHLEDRFIPNDELQYYLGACDVVVLPYADILTSGSAMLAISFGRPVIAPRLGHLQDVITPDCGVLYDPSEGAEGLSLAMEQVQSRQFDEAIIREHARTFDWRTAAKQTIAALSEYPDENKR
jgi:glycosyltransferase involved in cell wall biosynthesis